MKAAAFLLAALTLAVGPASFAPCASAAAAATGYACCRVCKAGKACGDSCIARDKTCHKGKGCACDG
jgi:hypothetical protein